MRNKRSTRLVSDFRIGIAIVVDGGQWSGRRVSHAPRWPNGLDQYPWILEETHTDGAPFVRRFMSREVRGIDWAPSEWRADGS